MLLVAAISGNDTPPRPRAIEAGDPCRGCGTRAQRLWHGRLARITEALTAHYCKTRHKISLVHECDPDGGRAIILTSLTMVLGALPLLFASDPAEESRFELGLVIVSGMLLGSFLTLFLLPSLYLFVHRNRMKPRL